MEIKKLQEELNLMLDVSRMSEEELEEKYAKDLETYQRFLMDFANVFDKHLPFPMLAYRRHDEISDMLKKMQSQFSDESISSLSSAILKIIDHERAVGNDEYNEQGIWLFRHSIGVEKMEKDIAVDSLLERMLKQTYAIEDASSSPNLDLEEVIDRITYARMQTEMDHDSSHLSKAYRVCSCAYPKMKLCYQPDFLLVANYVLMGFHPGVKADQEFIDLIKETIDFTKSYPMPFEIVEDYDMSNYRKLARLTEKCIFKYEQRERKKDVKEESNLDETKNCQEEKKLRKVFAKRR